MQIEGHNLKNVALPNIAYTYGEQNNNRLKIEIFGFYIT